MSVALPSAGPRVATLFRALADEKRLRILALLQSGEHCVCELTDVLGLPQSLLSFHLKALKEAGLVSDRRDGRWVHYSLVPRALEDAIGALHDLSIEPGERGRAPRC